MSDNDFAKRMSQVPDEELLSIVSSEGFLPAAVDAAKAEIMRRNLNPDDLTRIQTQVKEQQQVDENRPSIPLSSGGKMAFLVFGPLLIFTLAAAIALRTVGYRRKSNDAFKWIAISIVCWFTLGFITAAIA